MASTGKPRRPANRPRAAWRQLAYTVEADRAVYLAANVAGPPESARLRPGRQKNQGKSLPPPVTREIRGAIGLADAGQLLAVQHVDRALDAKGPAGRDPADRAAGHRADHGGGIRHRVPPQQ